MQVIVKYALRLDTTKFMLILGMKRVIRRYFEILILLYDIFTEVMINNGDGQYSTV